MIPSYGVKTTVLPLGPFGVAWQGLLKRFDPRHNDRLVRGRALARSGKIDAPTFSPGWVSALVHDGEAHRPTVRVACLTDAEWRRIDTLLASRLSWVAGLMAGDLDPAFIEAALAEGISLLPTPDQIDADCGCGDYALPCAHAAAVLHMLADAIDGDPALLFTLRGRDPARILAELRAGWGDEGLPPTPSATAPADLTSPRSPVPLPSLRFDLLPRAIPGVPDIGPLPGGESLGAALGPLYAAASEAAKALALAPTPDLSPLVREGAHEAEPMQEAQPAEEAEPIEEAEPAVAEPAAPATEAEPAAPTVVAPSRPADMAKLRRALVQRLAAAPDGLARGILTEGLAPEDAVNEALATLLFHGLVACDGDKERWWLG